MIDLHGHILPAIDDGPAEISTSLEIARRQVAQGVSVMACTPHILPGVYHNHGANIRVAVGLLQQELDGAGISLKLVTGADNHVSPDFLEGLRTGRLLTLSDSRYVLLEPPHDQVPARLDDFVFNLVLAGYVPVITHPERLRWIEDYCALMAQLVAAGAWMQVTSGSLLGRFGAKPLYWGERLLGEGLVHILASDVHDLHGRPPDLAEGWRRAERLVGAVEAAKLVCDRPRAVLMDEPPTIYATKIPDRLDGRSNDDKGWIGSASRRSGSLSQWLRRFFR